MCTWKAKRMVKIKARRLKTSLLKTSSPMIHVSPITSTSDTAALIQCLHTQDSNLAQQDIPVILLSILGLIKYSCSVYLFSNHAQYTS